jgi:energy-coupling factor transporter ATP-binding protein EcfA2
MRIQSVHLRNVRSIRELDLDFRDEATGEVRMRTVIAGSNGSGKTTLLETIFALCGMVTNGDLDGWLREMKGAYACAVLADLDSLWAGVDPAFDTSATLSLFVADNGFPVPNGPYLGWTRLDERTAFHAYSQAHWEAWTHQLRNLRNSDNAPGDGLLYIPSLHRSYLEPRQPGVIRAEKTPYQWIYRFNVNERWEGSLESYLIYLDWLDHRNGEMPGDRFDKFVAVANEFLLDKRITGVNDDIRVEIVTDSGVPLTIPELSAGEQQVLMLLGEIQRRIHRGSVILIDEPEIHLHPAWQYQFIQALTALCRQYNAQMIVTTHSEDTARAVFPFEYVELDDVFARAAQE